MISNKSKAGQIPVIIGVTGHRDLREQDIGILKRSVSAELAKLQAKYPHSQIMVMTSLAEGADQLCAETALEMGLEIISALPMPVSEYAEDFQGEYLEKLHYLTERSARTFVAPATEPFREGRDYLYRQACIYVAGHCHLLMALWDGDPGEPGGCGTAATVGIKLHNNIDGEDREQLRRADGLVLQIVTPRRKNAGNGLTAGEVIMHGDTGTFDSIMGDTDRYNLDCTRMPDTDIPDGNACSVTGKLDAVYETADRLSMINASKHRKTLAGLSICATVLTIAFLLYDEAEWQGMILLCGLMILALFAINALTFRTRFHERYIGYRILSEICRVQKYLLTGGSSCEVTEIMPWNLQVSIPWTGKAIASIMTGAEVREKESIIDSWVIDQGNYHRKALARNESQLKRNDRIVRTALIFTILIYLGALMFEVAFCGLLGSRESFSPEVNTAVRTGIKVALGAFSAGTLFANNYYGKQVLPNVIDDHIKMIMLYEEAEREIREKGETEPLLIRIAEDELEENANWYAYQSKQQPDLGI